MDSYLRCGGRARRQISRLCIHRKGQGPVFFGPAAGRAPQNRFDAPAGEYGVLYAAQRLEVAFFFSPAEMAN